MRLFCTGWRVLACRYKHQGGEIDLIALRGKTLAFIEVKARRSLTAALESIHPAQQQRIIRTAMRWLQKHPQYQNHTTRFDVMTVALWPWPQRLPNATLQEWRQ
jgi:putative endonuclease